MSNMAYSTNKKRKTCDKMPESSSLSLRRWKDLDLNILKKIFDDISYSDLFLNVSNVCKSWKLACQETLFWGRNTIDLSILTASFGNVNSMTTTSSFKFNTPEMYAMKLMKQLKNVMEGNDAYGVSLDHWRLSVRKVIIPYGLEISDKHLLYIAERTPALESLVLLGTLRSRITEKGFAKAICNWKNMKHIGLGKIKNDYFTKIIKEIGRYCPGLKTLDVNSFNFILKADAAHALAKNLPQLKTLRFEATPLYTDGLITIYKHCLMLEAIHFHDCYLMEYSWDPWHIMDIPAMYPAPLTFTLRLSEGKGSKGYRDWVFEAVPECVEPDAQSSLSDIFYSWIAVVGLEIPYDDLEELNLLFQEH